MRPDQQYPMCISLCQDLLKARGWSVTDEQSSQGGGWALELDLPGKGRKLAVKERRRSR